MLRDPDVKRWFDNLARGSPVSAEVALRRLSLFCEQNDVTARQLVELGKGERKTVEDLLQDHVTRMEEQGKAPGYISGVVKAVKSWLDHSGVEIKRRIKISNSSATPTIEDERVPEKDELRTLYMYGGERAKVIMALVSNAGLRLETLGNESGTDGLKMGDLPEMEIKDGRVEFNRIPTMVIVRPTLSKTRRKYFTFLTKEGCEYLKAYLEKRMAEGENLTHETPVIVAAPGYEQMGKSGRNKGSRFICTRNVSREIREAMRPRFKWRPYVLRAYFDTQMLLAESHGKLPHPYSVFFMGHKGDIEARYTTNKGRLPDNLIEDMRRSFEKCEEYLSTTPTKAVVDLEKAKIESLLAFAKLQKFPDEKVNSIREAVMKSENPTADKVIEMLSANADLSASFTIQKSTDEKPKMPQLNNNSKPYQSKIIGEKELVPYIEDGWEIVRELSNGRFLVKKPNHMEG